MINKYKSTILIILGILIAYQVSYAQETAKSFTLDEAIQYALVNNQQGKNARLDMEIAQREIDEVIARAFPQINARADVAYNIDIRQSPVPGDAFPGPDGLPGDPNEVVALGFGTPYTTDLGLTLDQMLIDGQFFAGLKAAKVFAELSKKDKMKTDIDIAESVSKAYFLVLINEERFDLIKRNFTRIDSLLINTKALYEGGFAEKIDVSRVQVQYNNLKVELDNYQSILDLSKSLLMFQMGLSPKGEIELTDRIEDTNYFDFSKVEGFTYENRIEYSQLDISKKLNELDIKTLRSQYAPQIGIYGQLGTNTGSIEASKIFSEDWYPYSVIGLRASMPIFDGFMRRRQVQQRELRAQKINNQFDLLKNNIDVEIENALSNYNREMQRMQAQKENTELAREVYDVAKLKYEEGVGSNIEVIDADSSYKEAQTNYYNALYDLLIAKISLQKAYGLLL